MTLSAAQFHRETSYRRDRMGGHFMDWANQPDVYKTYPGIEPIPLPREPALPAVPLFDLFAQNHAAVPRPELTAEDLSAILRLTHSLTAKAVIRAGIFITAPRPLQVPSIRPKSISPWPESKGWKTGCIIFPLPGRGYPCSAPGRSWPPFRVAARSKPPRNRASPFF